MFNRNALDDRIPDGLPCFERVGSAGGDHRRLGSGDVPGSDLVAQSLGELGSYRAVRGGAEFPLHVRHRPAHPSRHQGWPRATDAGRSLAGFGRAGPTAGRFAGCTGTTERIGVGASTPGATDATGGQAVTTAEVACGAVEPADQPRQPNHMLRRPRLGRPSPSGSGRRMSRQDLAEAVNAHVSAITGRVVSLDNNYVGKLERGSTAGRVPTTGRAYGPCWGPPPTPSLGFTSSGAGQMTTSP
jgi:hypothetical protein